jgi:hypothetical protein
VHLVESADCDEDCRMCIDCNRTLVTVRHRPSLQQCTATTAPLLLAHAHLKARLKGTACLSSLSLTRLLLFVVF